MNSTNVHGNTGGCEDLGQLPSCQMMRELDTVSPVVWPSWCYSGEGQNEGDNPSNASENNKDHSNLSHHISQLTPPKPRGKRRFNSLMSQRYQRQGGEVNGDATKHNESKPTEVKEIEVKKENVKTERLSPMTAATASAVATTVAATVTTTTPPTPVILGGVNSNAHGDSNSNSSRSGTPSSSYPGTPPGPVSDSREHGSSPSNASAHGQGSHLKQMEQMMMSRNYSDFMRSLAAKYNNSNPNDYFSSTRNGFPPSLDPRFGSYKSGTGAPFMGLMTPLSGTAVSPSNQQPTAASTSPSDHQRHLAKTQSDVFSPNFGVPGLNGLNPFAGSNINSLFPPMIDMSSTQALLSMVRTASAQNQAQLESYLKGAAQVHSGKRSNETSPLDLSSAALVGGKKLKKESVKDGLYDNLLNLPLLEALRTKELAKISTKNRSVSPNLVQKKNLQNSLNNLQNTISGLNARTSPHRASVSPRCSSLCGAEGRACGDSEGQSIAHWTVDDVCSFVSSIDICAEYEKNFREERIDGASLPLLTEEHLTNSLSMKLGPALKLRATIARRLGHCNICLHCVHCHGASSLGSSPGLPASVPGNRPNSAGN